MLKTQNSNLVFSDAQWLVSPLVTTVYTAGSSLGQRFSSGTGIAQQPWSSPAKEKVPYTEGTTETSVSVSSDPESFSLQ